MSFTKITDSDIANYGIQSQPNKLTGTAAQNKAKFDQLVSAVVKEKLNALIDELTAATAAGQIGVDTIAGITADTVQEALEAIMQSLQGITQGAVADGSITTAKLSDGAVTPGKLADSVTPAALSCAAADHTHAASEIASGTLAEDRIPALAAGKITSGTLAMERIPNLSAEKIVTGVLAEARIPTLGIAKVGLAANQVRPIFLTDTVPTSASADGIYLVYEAGE